MKSLFLSRSLTSISGGAQIAVMLADILMLPLASNIAFNGGVPVYVPMHPHVSQSDPKLIEWALDFEELE